MMLDSDGQSRHEQLHFDFLNLKNLYYQDEVTLTIKGSQLKLVKIWSEFTSLDFSSNEFRGGIPDAIGDLSSLYLLNLPRSLGKMAPTLEALDLSVNQLSEMIPVEIGQFGFLQVLNLSHNKLVGRIPRSHQLDTFDYLSYVGNAGLCGFPLGISCSDDDSLKVEKMEPHGKSEKEMNYICAEVGYAVGLGSTVWLLLLCPSLRERFFGKVDEVLANICERQRRKRSHRRRRRAAMSARRQ